MTKANQQQLILDKGLIAAAAASSILKVRLAMDFGANANFQDPDQFGWTALHFCCYFSGNEKPAERICKALLAKNANPDIQSTDGVTPLLAASSIGSLAAVRMLIEREADVNLADKVGKTPLMGAADRGSVDIATELLRAGADVERADKHGGTAISLARDRGHHDVAAVIEAFLIKSELSSQVRRQKM